MLQDPFRALFPPRGPRATSPGQPLCPAPSLRSRLPPAPAGVRAPGATTEGPLSVPRPFPGRRRAAAGGAEPRDRACARPPLPVRMRRVRARSRERMAGAAPGAIMEEDYFGSAAEWGDEADGGQVRGGAGRPRRGPLVSVAGGPAPPPPRRAPRSPSGSSTARPAPSPPGARSPRPQSARHPPSSPGQRGPPRAPLPVEGRARGLCASPFPPLQTSGGGDGAGDPGAGSPGAAAASLGSGRWRGRRPYQWSQWPLPWGRPRPTGPPGI